MSTEQKTPSLLEGNAARAIKTVDLGHGWFVSQNADGTMTFRNPDKGMRSDLPIESVKLLRLIIGTEGRSLTTPAAPADGKTPGQIAYEEDCRREPTYHNGKPRTPWDSLDPLARDSWERNPTVRASLDGVE